MQWLGENGSRKIKLQLIVEIGADSTEAEESCLFWIVKQLREGNGRVEKEK